MISNQKLIAGAKWDFTETFTDYPAYLYSSKIIIKKAANSPVEIPGTAVGDDHNFVKAAALTGVIPSGNYRFQYVFTNRTDANDVAIPYDGYVEIEAMLTADGDIRTHNRKMLEALQATAEGRATKEQLSQSYKGRVIQLLTLKELQDAIAYYENECNKEDMQEKIENGEDTGGRLFLSFE